jgi:hypothetical protein
MSDYTTLGSKFVIDSCTSRSCCEGALVGAAFVVHEVSTRTTPVNIMRS